MTSWYSVSVTVAPEAAEAIEYALDALDALGTEINHLRKKNLDSVTVVGYFNELPDEERVQDELQYALRIHDVDAEAVQQLERSVIEETDWLAEWKKHWRPTEIGGFVIAPSWSDVVEDGKIVIRIEPNMAFGTGTHETTQLCLAAIETEYVPGDSFLDVGTGTGILAIAAAKLNLRSQISKTKLLGLDTDVDSITIARENAEANGVGKDIEFTIGSISPETPAYDFVCANLTLDVIDPILPILLEKAKKTLLLSGILDTQKAEIVSRLNALGTPDPEIHQAGEWISVLVQPY
jgi:ribosomal protein L11 methyltransferase